MSSISIASAVGCAIQCITVFAFLKIILKDDYNKSKCLIKDFLSFVCLTISMFFIYNTEYNSINTIIIFLLICLGLFFIYKINLSKSFVCAGLFMIFLFISDLIVSVLWIGIFKVEDVRGASLYLILSNLFVGIVTIIAVKIKWIKRKLTKIIKITETRENIDTIIFIALLLIVLCIFAYLISKSYVLGKAFIIYLVGTSIFITLTIIFFKEKYEKDKIINKYDELFEYVKTFEEWMDTENMNIHESKNQLATLRDMIKNNKKAVQYIDNIIKERINTESQNISKLRYIPKGGLKGLLYYKITIAENNNLNLLIDVSKSSEAILKQLNTDENKMLCRLIGIFFDNAIESSRDSIKKIISCEIYSGNDALHITISNTFKGKIDLNKITENGYSTKGKKRGKGLYLAKKFSSKYNKFSLENRIINDYYIQKIIIKEYNQ